MLRKLHHRTLSDSGLTLVELLVAMSLVSILLMMFFSSNLFVQKLVNRWRESNSLAIQGEIICSSLKSDLERSISIQTADSLTYKLIQHDGDTVIYRLDSLNLWRGTRKLNGSGLSCRSLKLERISLEKPNPFDIFVNGSLTHQIELIEAIITLSYKEKQDTLTFLARLKNDAEIR